MISENIKKKQVGPDRSVLNNQFSSVGHFRNPEKAYCNFRVSTRLSIQRLIHKTDSSESIQCHSRKYLIAVPYKKVFNTYLGTTIRVGHTTKPIPTTGPIEQINK